MKRHWLLFSWWISLSWICDGFSPTFTHPVANITVARGRNAKFTCKVKHLGGYRVGWVKADTKAIQAIHTHVITHNQRVQVIYDDHSTWHLILKQVTEDDKGPYMCQINTDPMISQIGWLEVVTPPEIDDHYSSSEIVVTEGASAILRCVARGHPQPQITWKREKTNGPGITISDLKLPPSHDTTTHIGEVLELPKVSREHMGVYLCIANNNVPPQVSKRISLNVLFHPRISVPNQLIGAPYGSNITMQCKVEAYPTPVTFWNNENNTMLSMTDKYHLTTNQSGYSVVMTLVLIDLTPSDLGEYRCVARNSIGKVDSTIKINYIPPPTLPPTTSQPMQGPNFIEESDVSAQYHSTSSNLPFAFDNDVWVPSSSDSWSQNSHQTDLAKNRHDLIRFPNLIIEESSEGCSTTSNIYSLMFLLVTLYFISTN